MKYRHWVVIALQINIKILPTLQQDAWNYNRSGVLQSGRYSIFECVFISLMQHFTKVFLLIPKLDFLGFSWLRLLG